MDIKVTETAKSRLYDMGVSDNVFLRIGVKSGGCSGNTYDATLDDTMNEVDEVYYSEDKLRIVSDKISSVYLDGLTIDFSNDLIEPGFRLMNSNAKGSCGCGSSFSTGDPAPNVDASFLIQMVLNPISILGGDSVYCINEAQMEHAKKLAEEDPESSKKIKSMIDSLESDFTRNERAALAFTIIDNLRENREKQMEESINVLGGKLEPCSTDPMTGWFRDGCCNTDNRDFGRHVVCVVMTDIFLAFSKGAGNDLSSPGPGFSGLKEGDRWCLCLSRWVEAYDSGMAPQVVLEATHESALEMVSLDKLKEFAYKEE